MAIPITGQVTGIMCLRRRSEHSNPGTAVLVVFLTLLNLSCDDFQLVVVKLILSQFVSGFHFAQVA